MKYTVGALALAGSVLASPYPQGVTSSISAGKAPAGCSSSAPAFQITVQNVTSSGKVKRQLDGPLTITLTDGVMKDQAGRTGYIAANYQFQFDNPPQTGAVYTSGFSLCANGTVAHGPSAVWAQCYSGGFYNLYDRNWASTCNDIYIISLKGGSSGGSSSAAGGATVKSDGQPAVTTQTKVTQLTDGQPQATSVAVTQISDGQPQAVTQISDGQPQAPKGAPVTQISDGQPQASSAAPAPAVTQISDGQPQASSAAPAVTQISDGQPQASSAAAAPVTQISDGQPQASSAAAAPVTQISDGQPQASSAAPAPAVTQISDGQPQASSAAGAPVTQISDGQPQATSAAGAPVTQISDGQPQASTAGSPISQISDGQPQAATATPAAYTGAASPLKVNGMFGALAIGVAALL